MTTPSTGMFIMAAIRTAFSTMRETKSCGEVTMTMPSIGKLWKTVNGTSPVPGGMSIYISSISP